LPKQKNELSKGAQVLDTELADAFGKGFISGANKHRA
jgi:hypothetical protein